MEKRRNEISILRIISMFMIVLCHIIGYYTFIPGYTKLGNVFNVGVYVFLLISGFLYGNKKIVTAKGFLVWYGKRIKKIHLPVLVVVIVDLLILKFCFNMTIPLKTQISYLLNLQGLQHIAWKQCVDIMTEITNLGPLWFTTVIMLCYLFVPLFGKIREKLKDNDNKIKIDIFSIACCCVIAYIVQVTTCIILFYFVTFYIGFVLSDYLCYFKNMNVSKLVCLMSGGLIFQILRLILMKPFDGNMIYVSYTSVSHIALALCIFVFFVFLGERYKNRFDKLADLKICKYLDKESFNIYLVHGLFCLDSNAINLYNGKFNIWISTLLFVISILVSAAVLKLIVNGIEKLFSLIIKNNHSR